ncbi:hypothetical protein [Halomonas sp. CKK8]|uniref:hypothetical protein n=1 Tax=Halomonas sp. CKK8 TaxID=3036127 RepID=UPI002415491D|nr:hypothetical protein [Halomonas sp. CKK8]WFM72967.1 hypothetical protein P8934_08215 [Halomonas sp. CKK8]
MSDPIRVYDSGMQGAPVLMTRSLGSLKEVLEQVLVNGFNASPADDLTYDAEAGEGVLLFSGGHGFVLHQVVEVSGANETEWNGLWKVTGVENTTVRFSMDSVPAGNATGSLAVKTASAGWTMPHESSDGYRAIFQPSEPSSPCYYIDNSDWETAPWGYKNEDIPQSYLRGYLSATDIDTRLGEFGDGGLSQDTYAAYTYYDFPRHWRIVANSRFVWMLISDPDPEQSSIADQCVVIAFGDVAKGRPGCQDAFIGLMETGENDESPENYMGYFNNSTYKRVSRGLGGRGLSLEMRVLSYASSLGDTYVVPDTGDNKARLELELPVLAKIAGGGYVPVGVMPGLANCLSGMLYNDNTTIEVEGRTYWVWLFAGTTSSDYYDRNSMALIDITGPWH